MKRLKELHDRLFSRASARNTMGSSGVPGSSGIPESDFSDKTQVPEWELRHKAMKEEVGMAEYGTSQYERNAAKVVAVHAGPGTRPGTRAELRALVDSDDPVARQTARDALQESGDDYE